MSADGNDDGPPQPQQLQASVRLASTREFILATVRALHDDAKPVVTKYQELSYIAVRIIQDINKIPHEVEGTLSLLDNFILSLHEGGNFYKELCEQLMDPADKELITELRQFNFKDGLTETAIGQRLRGRTDNEKDWQDLAATAVVDLRRLLVVSRRQVREEKDSLKVELRLMTCNNDEEKAAKKKLGFAVRVLIRLVQTFNSLIEKLGRIRKALKELSNVHLPLPSQHKLRVLIARFPARAETRRLIRTGPKFFSRFLEENAPQSPQDVPAHHAVPPFPNDSQTPQEAPGSKLDRSPESTKHRSKISNADIETRADEDHTLKPVLEEGLAGPEGDTQAESNITSSDSDNSSRCQTRQAKKRRTESNSPVTQCVTCDHGCSMDRGVSLDKATLIA